MLFTKLVLSVVVVLPTIVSAAIDTLVPYSGTYHATSASVFPLTFTTSPRPTPQRDFSIAVGLGLANTTTYDTALGERFIANYDLVGLGYSSTGVGNFTINMPLPSEKFYAGNGTYTITVGLTTAYGPQQTGALLFKRINVTVTV